MKIAVIGGGAMGLAFVRAWIDGQVQDSDNLLIVEKSPERREVIESEVAVRLESSVAAAKDAGLIFIAVKPQDFASAAQELSEILKPEQFVVSIMAGIPISAISAALKNHLRVARVMPNLPIVVGAGISAYYVDENTEHVAVSILDQLLKAGGATLRLASEDLLNAVTALSGSGPGYIYYLLKHAVEMAEEFGFTAEQGKLLLGQTMIGAAKLWIREERSAEELCRQVTSKGGTTHAALAHFDEKKLGETLKEGLRLANKRAVELASGS